MSNDNLNNYTKNELIKKVESLENELSQDKTDLIKRVRDLEANQLLSNIEHQKQKQKINDLKNEITTLRETPLILANVIEIMDDSRVVVRGLIGHNYLVKYPETIDRKELVPGARVSLNQSTLSITEVFPGEKGEDVVAMEVDERPKVKYEDIGGLDNQILELKETVELPLKSPEIFEEVGIDPPKGVLLFGPPGTGKTLLAKAVARETNATFIKIVASEFANKFLGEGARMVREVFELSQEKAPAIIFIDEIDAVGAKRNNISDGADREVQRTLMQLLSELDGFDPRGNVGIIGATNRPDILDPALLRPGRFDRSIEVPLPNKENRKKIFEIHTQRMNLNDKIDFDKLSEHSEGLSGAELKAICTEAGMFAIRDDRRQVNVNDFINAITKIDKQTSY